jgi:hypothetical protein
VQFKNIRSTTDPLRVELKTSNAAPAVEDVVFEDVIVIEQPLARADVQMNAFMREVAVCPSHGRAAHEAQNS